MGERLETDCLLLTLYFLLFTSYFLLFTSYFLLLTPYFLLLTFPLSSFPKHILNIVHYILLSLMCRNRNNGQETGDRGQETRYPL